MKITAKPMPGRQGFRCAFQRPDNGRVSSYGLGTTDEFEAQRICNEVVEIFDDRSLLEDPKSPRLLAYHPRAVQIVFYGKKNILAALEQQRDKPTLDAVDIGTLGARLIRALGLAGVAGIGAKRKLIDLVLGEYESRRYGDLQRQYVKLENEVRVSRPRIEYLERELQRHERALNLHVTVTMKDALTQWEIEYRDGRGASTYAGARYAVRSFMATLPAADACKLAEVRAKHIDAWLLAVKSEDGAALSPITRKKMKAYLSVFFSWALRKYDLAENPLDRTGGIAGVARYPEHILAVRRLKDLQELLSGLGNAPYWRAWVAVAVLAGPRYAEQCWLKLDDVYLDEGYLRITSRASGRRIVGTKTGRERNVPVEKTVLKRILAAHIKARREEQQHTDATVAQKSPWLFPSTAPENEYRPRWVSEPGQWSQSSIFLGAWDAARRAILSPEYPTLAAALSRAGGATDGIRAAYREAGVPEFWNYGPKEWRHTYGTLLGQCGWSSLEISRTMGNSPTIAERHYISVTDPGKRWPFRF